MKSRIRFGAMASVRRLGMCAYLVGEAILEEGRLRFLEGLVDGSLCGEGDGVGMVGGVRATLEGEDLGLGRGGVDRARLVLRVIRLVGDMVVGGVPVVLVVVVLVA